jgi:hypothetical protein
VANRLGYEAVFSASAVEFSVGLSKRRQRKLLGVAQELAADPFLVPDCRTKDVLGREISQILAEGFIFDFWVDHAVKRVFILDIGNVD